MQIASHAGHLYHKRGYWLCIFMFVNNSRDKGNECFYFDLLIHIRTILVPSEVMISIRFYTHIKI